MDIQPISAEDVERYRVVQRTEIEQTLRKILHARSSVDLVSEDRLKPILRSSLVQVDKNKILLDASPDSLINQVVLKTRNLLAVTEHDQVQIRFPCRSVSLDQDHASGAVISAAYPGELIRLQRRNSYRLGTSVVHPVKCLIGKDGHLMEATVVDLSVGGVGVLAYRIQGELTPGETYHGCRLALPESGEFAVSMTVRSTYEVARPDGQKAHRAGCQFIDLPASIETQIQRYILRVDRERRARFI